MEVERQEETIDLLELFGELKQHIVAIVLCTVIAAVVGFVFTAFLATPQYEASALMIVNTRQDTTSTVTSDQLSSASRLVDTYGIIIKSDPVLLQVASNLGLTEDLEKVVTVAAVDDTQVMRVAVTDPDPEMARRICEQITQISPDIILEAVAAGSVKVISPARLTPEPVSPHVLRDTVIMAVLGLVLCVGVIFLRFVLDNKINNESDVAKYLDLPVLGVIPKYEEGR